MAEIKAKRLTLKRGSETKIVVIDVKPTGPYNGPQVPVPGDEVFSGGDDPWEVSKVEECEVLLRIPFPASRNVPQREGS